MKLWQENEQERNRKISQTISEHFCLSFHFISIFSFFFFPSNSKSLWTLRMFRFFLPIIICFCVFAMRMLSWWHQPYDIKRCFCRSLVLLELNLKHSHRLHRLILLHVRNCYDSIFRSLCSVYPSLFLILYGSKWHALRRFFSSSYSLVYVQPSTCHQHNKPSFLWKSAFPTHKCNKTWAKERNVHFHATRKTHKHTRTTNTLQPHHHINQRQRRHRKRRGKKSK